MPRRGAAATPSTASTRRASGPGPSAPSERDRRPDAGQPGRSNRPAPRHAPRPVHGRLRRGRRAARGARRARRARAARRRPRLVADRGRQGGGRHGARRARCARAARQARPRHHARRPPRSRAEALAGDPRPRRRPPAARAGQPRGRRRAARLRARNVGRRGGAGARLGRRLEPRRGAGRGCQRRGTAARQRLGSVVRCRDRHAERRPQPPLVAERRQARAAARAHEGAGAADLGRGGRRPAVIGSGLVAATAVGAPPPAELPPWIAELIARVGPGEPGSTLPAELIGTLDAAIAAAARAADARGLTVRVLAPPASGDVLAAASRFAHELALTTEDVLLWGGETTVRLPAEPGRGGRNQQFALAAARLISGHPRLVLLAAGTDGSDGNTDDAGAIVDGGTLVRGREAGFEADVALEAANAGPFLAAAGDLLHTGPTGTNVGDLMIGLGRGAAPAEA